MLNKNFRDMLSAFGEAGVDYLLIDAYAMAAHGCPRATGDIDIWVRPTKENAQRVWAALQNFGAPLSKVTPEDFCTPEIVYQMGLPPQRIDILTSISGVDFDDAWPQRMIVPIDGLSVAVIGLRQLYANKLAAGRDKDQQDAKILKELTDNNTLGQRRRTGWNQVANRYIPISPSPVMPSTPGPSMSAVRGTCRGAAHRSVQRASQ